MKYIKELKEKIRIQDIKCDELIKQNPAGYHDREFEELVILKSKLEGAEAIMEELTYLFKHSPQTSVAGRNQVSNKSPNAAIGREAATSVSVDTLPKIYYCKKCDRYTDVRYISDKAGGRKKSYCYKCYNEAELEAVYIHSPTVGEGAAITDKSAPSRDVADDSHTPVEICECGHTENRHTTAKFSAMEGSCDVFFKNKRRFCGCRKFRPREEKT